MQQGTPQITARDLLHGAARKIDSLAYPPAMMLATGSLTGGGASGYAVGWLTLALINSGLAQGKNRSGIVWFLLSLLLGPVATFLVVVIPGD